MDCFKYLIYAIIKITNKAISGKSKTLKTKNRIKMILEYFLNLPIKFIKGIYQFFYFWYLTSSKNFWHREVGFLKQIERDIGVIINLKLIFQPIFGDYTYAGRVIGPIFRLGRVLIGTAIMLVSIFVVILLYIIWIILPPLAFLMVVLNLIS